MKLSVWSSYYIHLSPEDALRELTRNGIFYSELSDEHSAVLLQRGDADTVGTEFRRFADGLGIKLPQGHLFLQAKICEKEWQEKLKEQLRLFRAVGVKNAVLHCSAADVSLSETEKREAYAEALRVLADFAKEYGITLCLENLGPQSAVPSAEAILALIRETDRPNLGICLDTGHLNLCEEKDQAAFLRTAGKYLKALHLADNDGSGDQHLMPYGKGRIDFPQVIAVTKEIGYDGIYNFEIPGERKAPLEILGYKLEYLKKIFSHWEENF